MRYIKTYIISAVLLVIGLSVQANMVDGFVYKPCCSDHDNIYVRLVDLNNIVTYFTAFTDKTGYYKLEVPEGEYKVYFVAVGFEKCLYASNLIISGSVTFDSKTLISEKYRIINKQFPAILSKDSVYYILNNIEVDESEVIKIEYGALLKLGAEVDLVFNCDIQFYGDGDSVKINSIDQEKQVLQWNKILFNGSLQYSGNSGRSHFLYGKELIFAEQALSVKNCEFGYIKAIKFEQLGTSMIVEDCMFSFIEEGISINTNVDNLFFHKNNVYECSNGLQLNDNSHTLIDANRFEGCSQALNIEVDALENTIVSNNIFKENMQAIRCFTGGIQILNNVFYQNFFDVVGKGAMQLINNIFSFCNTGSLFFYIDESVSIDDYHIEYNLFWDNGFDVQVLDGDSHEFIEVANDEIVNQNGFPCDINYNIRSNPGFTNFDNFELSIYSPAVDAGKNVVDLIISDFEGNYRLQDGNSDGIPFVDMGCVETTGSIEDHFSIFGRVEYDGNPYPGGEVILYKIENDKYFAIDHMTINQSGYFYFPDLWESKFLLHVVPEFNDGNPVLPTYFIQNTSWKNSTPIALEGRGLNANIWMMPYLRVEAGSQEVSGIIDIPSVFRNHDEVYSEAWLNEKTAANPLDHVTVFLKKNNKIIDWTLTKEGGRYKFENVISGEYELVVEYPGYSYALSEITNDLESEKLNELLNEISSDNSEIKVFPIPVTNYFYLPEEFFNEQGVISIYKADGRLIKQMYQEGRRVEVDGMKGGIYFVNYKTHEGFYRCKIVVD